MDANGYQRILLILLCLSPNQWDKIFAAAKCCQENVCLSLTGRKTVTGASCRVFSLCMEVFSRVKNWKVGRKVVESCRTSQQVFCLPSCKVFGKRIAADQKPHDGFLLCPLCWTLVTLRNKDPLHHWNLKAPSDRGSIALPTWGFPGPPHQRPRVAHDVTENCWGMAAKTPIRSWSS